MLERHATLAQRLALPVSVAAAIIASAPWVPLLRDGFFSLFPRHAVGILIGMLLLILVAALATAIARMRTHLLLRMAGLLMVLLAVWLQAVGLSQHLPANIALTVSAVERIHIFEYGTLALLLVRALRPVGWAGAASLASLWAALVGVLDETVQMIVPGRTGELRDIAIDVAAGVTGACFALCLESPAVVRERGATRTGPRLLASWWPIATRSAAILILAGGLFVSFAHLGYRIDDPAVGRFLSWHTADQLHALAAERAMRWRGPDPPTGRELCCIQDVFLTEASRHNTYRNERFRSGDRLAAWHADNLLRTYFAPYLDKPLPPDGRRPRDEIYRAALEQAGRGHDPGDFDSPVLRGRIWTRPSKKLWLTVTLLLFAWLWALPALARRRHPR